MLSAQVLTGCRDLLEGTGEHPSPPDQHPLSGFGTERVPSTLSMTQVPLWLTCRINLALGAKQGKARDIFAVLLRWHL